MERLFLADMRASRKTGEATEAVLRTDDRVIARITDGIYRQPSSALRELISNAYDADATEVIIETDAPRFNRIEVRDNGNGMDEAALSRLIYHSPVTGSNNGPRYMSIEPIVSQPGQPVDLIAVATPFYKGYSVQYLKNDGEGNFTDETDAYFPGADMDYISTTDENYVWMRRVFAFDRNGVQDIIARSAGTEEVSSQVYLNKDGVFHSALTVHGYTIESAMEIEGKPVLLISNTQNLALMAYPE